jgi:nucleoside-diphosphate-sugar epimerase
MKGRLYVVGLGFSGLEIARRATAEGWVVAGSVTSDEKAVQLRAEGVDAEVLSPSSEKLRAATHMVSTVAPDGAGDPVLPLVRHAPVKWLGYVSTTGVYGDRGGGWVDESDAPNPVQPRSRHRVEAEQEWQALARKAGVPLDVFRLPAIYGPGRSALDQVLEGRAQCVDKPGQVFSRVHAHDIASAVLAAMSKQSGAIYNVCDDEPCAQFEVIAFAAKLLGRPAPKLVPWEEAAPKMSEMARSFYAENRRVRNERMKRELGVVLRYPTYREGLSAIAAQRNAK